MLDRPDLLDHVYFVILAAVLGPRAFFAFRGLREAAPEDRKKRRLRSYRGAMISQWVLAAGLLAHWMVRVRPWVDLGLSPRLTGGAIGVTSGLIVIVAMMVVQSRGAAGRERALERARERMRHVEFILPHDAEELRLFTALSITAGVCEELLFRGFLIWYVAHWTGWIQAALLSSLVFGLGHLYQGPRGILLTAAVGAFLSAVYLVSGSLYLPMLIHAAVDVYSGRTGYALLQSEAEKRGAAPVDPARA